MALTDGDVAVLARQAVDLLDPTVEVAIEPGGSYDPYARGEATWTVWPRIDGHRSFGVHVYARDSGVQALARLVDGLSEHSSESERFRGRPFPRCPGHLHPATVGVDGDAVILTCPQTGAQVARIHPDGVR